MKSHTTGSSLSSKHLDRSKSRSVGSISNPFQSLTHQISAIKNSLQSMFRRRSSTKTSIDQLQRNRRHIKASHTSYTFYEKDCKKQQKLINLKYQNVKYKPLEYDYTHLFFPSRQRYVKTSKKGKSVSMKREQQFVGEYFGSVRMGESCSWESEAREYQRTNQHWRQYKIETTEDNIVGEKGKEKGRVMTAIGKWRGVGLKSRNQKSKLTIGKEIQIDKLDVNLSPWENDQIQL